MPEYMKKRFGGRRLRVYYALVQLVLAILTGISVSLSGWFIYMFIVIITNTVSWPTRFLLVCGQFRFTVII